MRQTRYVRYIAIGTLALAGLLVYLHAAISMLDQRKIETNPRSNTVTVISDGDSGESLALKQAEADNAARLQRVQAICYKYNLGLYKHSSNKSAIQHPPTPQYGVFYIDRVHKLSWCPIYKAGSTTWLSNLLLLSGYKKEDLENADKQLSELARNVYGELDAADAEEAFHNSMKLLVVRHPFARLLSAYRDKLENKRLGWKHGTKHFYQKYGRKIVTKYRQKLYKGDSTKVLNPEQIVQDPNLPRPEGSEPTFKEFVNYLLDTDLVHNSDDHWIPYYLFCTPCLLNYDVIAQVETLNRDQNYVIRSAGLEELITPIWTHKTAVYQASEIARRYFSQLSKEEVKKLYEKYKLDFELFGYEMENYLDYATIFKCWFRRKIAGAWLKLGVHVSACTV